MPTERQALFLAACADHENDTPRLAFADWLDENDEPALAEFVRIQVEFARLMMDASDSQPVYEFLRDRDWVTRPAAKWDFIDAGLARRFVLSARIDELLREHGPSWSSELPNDCGVNWSGFHGGFASRAIIMDLDTFLASSEELRAAAPPVELVCHGLTQDDAIRIADAGLLPWIRGLELDGDYTAGLRELGKQPAATAIRSLSLRTTRFVSGAEVAEALAGSPHWSGLDSLDTRSLFFDPTSAEVLMRASHLRGLRRMDIRTSGSWSADTIRVLAETGFPNLVDLRFVNCDLNDDAVEVLANIPSLGNLRNLDVGHNQITGRGATALLCSPHLSSLAFIGLEANPIRGLDRKSLKIAPTGGLRLLHCHGCRLTVADVAALSGSPRLHDLWYLDLDENALMPGAVRKLIHGLRHRCPPVIWLTMNRLDDAAAVLLANWPAATNLRVVQLGQNSITDFGVRTLLNSPNLKNLDGLGVPTVSESVAAAVRERFGDHGRLE